MCEVPTLPHKFTKMYLLEYIYMYMGKQNGIWYICDFFLS